MALFDMFNSQDDGFCDIRGEEIPIIIPACPFCGEKEKLSIRWYVPEAVILGRLYQIHCHACGATGPRGRTMSEAGSAWSLEQKA